MDDVNKCLDCKVRGLCCHEATVKGGTLYIHKDRPCEFLDQDTGLCTVFNERFIRQPRCASMQVLREHGGVPDGCNYKDDNFKYKKVVIHDKNTHE